MTAAQKVLVSNPRIEIRAEGGWWGFASVDNEVKQLHEVITQIKRHVDGVGIAVVLTDKVTVCAYCEEPVSHGYYDDGTPACCDAAVAEHETQAVTA